MKQIIKYISKLIKRYNMALTRSNVNNKITSINLKCQQITKLLDDLKNENIFSEDLIKSYSKSISIIDITRMREITSQYFPKKGTIIKRFED